MPRQLRRVRPPAGVHGRPALVGAATGTVHYWLLLDESLSEDEMVVAEGITTASESCRA
jgi:hypothetical protein